MAQPSLDMVSIDSVLKSLYRDSNYGEATYTETPFLGMLPKFTGFVGRDMPLPIKWANPGGIGNTFANAQSNTFSSRFSAFLLTRKKIYGTAKIEGEAIAASANDQGAFINALTAEIENLMEGVAQKMETDLFGSGTGTIGFVGTGFNTNTITLQDVNSVVNFEVGMTLVASPTDGAANRAGSEILAKVDRDVGTIVSTSATWNTVIVALANGDALMRQGDLNLAYRGLAAWLPTTVTLVDSFLGVNRSFDRVRLAGVYYDASTTGESIEESLIEGQSKLAKEGGKPDTVLLGTEDYSKLVKSAGSRVQYPRTPTSRKAMGEKGEIADIAFQGLRLEGLRGPMDVFSCPKAPNGTGWMLQMNTWQFASAGSVPQMLFHNGMRVFPIFNDDGLEVRVGGYGELGCKLPGRNARITFAS